MTLDSTQNTGTLGKLYKGKKLKSILILGSTGMLGFGVLSSMIKYKKIKLGVTVRSKKKLKYIKKKFPFNKVERFHLLNLAKINQKKINKIVDEYDYIINCIGVIKPEINIKSSKSIKNAIFINSVFPKMLSNSILNNNKKIYQIATDCVFSGKKGKYNEKSKHDDLEIYGISKSLGEINCKNFFNLRTSIVGRELLTKKSLIEWFLDQKKGVNGFENHNWNGLTTKAFGEFIYTLIINEIKTPNMLHVIPRNILSKYKLLKIFKQKFKTKFKINKYKAKVTIDRSLSTNHVKIINKIWKKTIFKTSPTILKMINKM